MKHRVVILPSAHADLGSISDFLADSSEHVAARFIQAASDTFDRIAAFPKLGHPRHFRDRRLRGFRSKSVIGFSNYLVFYQLSDDHTVRIARVLHGAMRIRARLLKQSE